MLGLASASIPQNDPIPQHPTIHFPINHIDHYELEGIPGSEGIPDSSRSPARSAAWSGGFLMRTADPAATLLNFDE